MAVVMLATTSKAGLCVSGNRVLSLEKCGVPRGQSGHWIALCHVIQQPRRHTVERNSGAKT